MPFKFHCGFCQQRLEVEDDQVGQMLPCPTCSITIEVPNLTTLENSPSVSPSELITISRDGETNGPFTQEQIQLLIREGKFTIADYAWREGEADWKTLSDLLGNNFPPVAPTRIYVGNLPFDATEADLQSLFIIVAPVVNSEICRNPKTNRSKGFGFVHFSTVEEASKAIIAFHDKEFMGRRLVVSGAKALPEGYIAEEKIALLPPPLPHLSSSTTQADGILFSIFNIGSAQIKNYTQHDLKSLYKEWQFPRLPTHLECEITINFTTNLAKRFSTEPIGFFGRPPLYIPQKIFNGAKSEYLRLKEDELLLAIYDSTIFAKDATTGFALTTKRIYWKNLFGEAKSLEYAHIVGPVGCPNNQLSLGDGDHINIKDDARPLLLALSPFLRAVALCYGTPLKLLGLENFPEDIEYLLKPHLYELDKLVGLARVKNDLKALTNSAKVNQLRKAQGLKTPTPSLHMVFSGGPGTGKTTVARLIGRIYRSLGLLKKGHCVEVNRSDLVAGYVGQTAPNTTQALQSALGGVLFIDEAYTLVDDKEASHRWGQESIDTILKFMEDHRSEIVVIVAGYPHEMTRFISSNPGLESRFTNYLFFENYTTEELTEIFLGYCKESDYNLAAGVEEKLKLLFERAYRQRDQTFSNARFVRTVFEKTVSNQAKRLIELQNPDQDSLREIRAEDIAEGDAGKKRAQRPKKTEQDLKVIEETWRNIAIAPEVKTRLKALAQHFDEGSEAASKGLLLYGPPGTGKTMIAKTLAESMGCDFFPLSLPDLKGAHLGESGQKVKELWERALAQPMSVIFVDECEGVFGRRGSVEGDKLTDEIVQSFLAKWDGFSKQNTVWVVGATNRRDLIDPAILSRFGEEVEIGLPNEEQRLEILGKELEKRDVSPKLPPEAAILTQGFSGRDLASLAGRLARELMGGEISAEVLEHYTSAFRQMQRPRGRS